MRLQPAPPVEAVRPLTTAEVLDLAELHLIADVPPPPEVAFVFDLATAVPPQGDEHDHPAR